ncbi:hypothetical protein ACRRTK_021591 [Alexandromys fortis]
MHYGKEQAEMKKINTGPNLPIKIGFITTSNNQTTVIGCTNSPQTKVPAIQCSQAAYCSS